MTYDLGVMTWGFCPVGFDRPPTAL